MKFKMIDTNNLDDLNDLYKILEDTKDFDLYVIFLMFKNELLKRGFNKL